MTKENKALAVELITASNSPKVSFRVPVTDNYSAVHEILIHECNADLINRLIAYGFSLFMTPKGLSVDKFS
jgi:hypothetical protein